MRKILLLSVLLLGSGCARPIPPATPLPWTAADSQANNGKQVSIEGYPRLPSMGMVSDTMLIELHESKDDPRSRSLTISVKIGSGKNQLEKPPADYSQQDLRLHTDDGGVVGANDRVRVSGQVVWMDAGKGAHSTWLDEPLQIHKL